MAAPAAAAGSAPGLCPGYAVICSFLERYGVLLDLPEFTFPQLERYLSDTSSVPKLLVDLHIKLLRKIGKSVSADRWEKHLVKVCQDFNTTWAWELDKKGYKDMTVECKTGILKYLCECQFDDNVKFKNAINEEDPDKMRLQPIGRDKDGQMYWFQLDQDHNVRVYLEEQDDLDGSSWKCLVRDRNELAEILASLKTHIDPELLKKEQEEAASLKPEADGNKKTDDEDNKKTDETTEDEEDKASTDVVSPVVSKEEDNKKLKQESEIDVSEAKSLLNDIQHSKTVSEPNTQSDKPCVDVHAKPIKEEPMEVSETTASKATSAKESLSECALRHTEQEDVRKKNTEDLQKAMKNDHQAKIPLKKREMKLSEDFDKSSGSIIVRNPSISQVKEPLIVEKINEENDKSARVKDLSSDNVNLESLYTTDNVKSHNNGLGKASKESEKQNVFSDSNEKQTNSLSGGECEPKEKRTEASTDKMNSRVDMDDVARNTEEPIEVTMSTQEEKEKAATQETIVEVVQEVAPLSSSLVAIPSPSSKEPIKPFEKSSDYKDEKNNESNEMCVISHAKGNTCISKETTKALTPEKHTEFDKPKKKGALKGKDSTELSEIEKSDVTKPISEPKPTETILTTDTGKPEHVTHTPDSSTQLKEMPGVIHKMETTLSNKETAEKLHGSTDSEIASVIKKTEVLKQSKGPESKDSGSLVSSKETNKSSVIKQADKTSSSKETQRSDSSNDKTKLLVMNKVNEQELSEHSKNFNSPKDTQTSCSTGRNSEIAGAEVITETSCITGKNSEISEAEVITEKEERVVFKVNSGNSARCQHKEKISNERSGKDSSKPDSKAVDVMAIKDNATQLEDHISIKELPTSKATEKFKEEKNTSLNPVEKGEPSNKVGQLVDNKSEAENKKKKIFDAPKEETLMPLVESSKSEESKMDTTLNAETVTGENKEPKICNETDTRNSESKTIKDHSTAICDTTSAKQPAKIEKEALTPVIDDKSKKDSCSNIEIKSVSLVEKTDKADDLNKDNDKTSTVDKLEGSKASEEFEDKAKEHNTVNKDKKVEKCDSTEVHEKGIRLKIQVPTRRQKSEVQREERTGDSDSETGGGRSLRRSPRISRPTAKVVEIQDRRLEKLQATASVEKEEEEEEEEKEEQEGQDEKVVLKKPREKKIDQEGQPKKGKKRRRTRWSSTRTRCNKKGSGDDDDDEDESSEQEDSEDEDDSDEDYKVERGRKRRRNRNRERHSSDSSTSSDDDLPPNDDPCKQCGLPNQPELILLCDSCDNGYHTACLRPPLMIIPDGEWFCPPCQHKQLCDKLEEQLQNIDAALKKRDRAERRKERLVYVGISVENIIAPSIGVEEEKEEVVAKEKKEVKKNKIKSKSWGRRSTRTKKSISYRFDEFDEAIEEAIEEDVKEAEGGGAGRGKDMANITGHRGKDMSTILHGEDGKENGCPPRPSVGQRRKKRRRLNDLDSDSTVDEEESEEEFRLSDSTEEEEFVVSENAESEAEVDFNDSDFGSTGSDPRHTARSKRPTKRRKSGRQPRKRRNRGYSDDEEEETDEEDEEEEMVTEGSSEFSDSDLDVSRRRSRRSLKKQVNYCETSESEGSKAGTNRDKMKPRRRLSSSDSEASHSRGSEEEEKETRVKRRTVSPSESRKRHRLFSLKRRRASEDDDDDDDSDDSEEEDRPVRKRVNRIDSDDSDEEEDNKTSKAEKKDDEGILGKGPNPLEYNLVELPPTNGQNSMKGLEGFINRPEPGAAICPPGLTGPKNICVTPVGAIAPNGMATQEMVPQDDDEDDLLGVTDLVDYVCNSEQL